jgi:hypothetical protein
MVVLLDIYRGTISKGLHAGTLNQDIRYLERRLLIQVAGDSWEVTDAGDKLVRERLGENV